jgi:hypothetical protein
MRKSEFMATLRVEVCATVDAALTGTGRDSQGCPWIDHWFGYYEGRSASQIERSLHRYAPEAAGVSTASQYIRIVAARVRKSAERWGRTGEITGMPEDMPAGAMPGGSLLAGFGGMFFKARPGGPGHADPVSIRDQLGGGQSLPGSVRTRMELAFGTSFGHVRLHTGTNAALLSDRLNARAFTIGQHVAFGGGEFRPGTLAGDALIAHELAHVVQQGQSTTASSGPFHKGARGAGGQAVSAYEDDADVSAAGAVARLWTGAHGHLSDIGRQAMPRMRSGLQLQRCGKQKGAEGPKAKLSVLEARTAAIKDAGDRLRAVDTWAKTQMKVTTPPRLTAVVNLDPKQADNVASAVDLLERAEALFGTKALTALPAKLDEVVNQAKEAWKKSGSGDEIDVMQGKHALHLAVEKAGEAGELVSTLSKSFDVANVAATVNDIIAALNDAQAGRQNLSDVVDTVDKKTRKAKEQLRELRERFEKTPRAITRIIFVLKSFLALNAPGRTSAPSADELAAFKGTTHILSEDFSTVFAEGKTTQAFDVFTAYAEVLQQQMAVRDKMAKEGVEAHAPIPTQGDAESFFKSLKSRSNKEVFTAYTDYASAYFHHREVVTLQDMNEKGVADLYQRQLSIFGTRPLVCTGYALLGSHLLKLAGATFDRFILAVRATDEDLVTNRVDSGHALAAMKRNGTGFFVSNNLIVFTKNDGIGPDAVAWGNSKAPLREAAGATIPGTNTRLANDLAARIRALQRTRSQPEGLRSP